MRVACFTVDMDRDVNFPSSDDRKAHSLDRGSGTAPRFSSSVKGASILAEIFEDMGMNGTFFAEARTLAETNACDRLGSNEVAMHGLDHEDMTGETCGSGMDEDAVRTTLTQAMDMIQDVCGVRPIGFRAPYMRFDLSMYHILKDIGMRYDSSQYADMHESMMPYRIYDGITEFPVPRGTDRSGRPITAYLWPMHEGKRKPDDYMELASGMKDGVFVIATHTWHMCESRERGIMGRSEMERNADSVRMLIEGLTDRGFEFRTMGSMV